MNKTVSSKLSVTEVFVFFCSVRVSSRDIPLNPGHTRDRYRDTYTGDTYTHIQICFNVPGVNYRHTGSWYKLSTLRPLIMSVLCALSVEASIAILSKILIKSTQHTVIAITLSIKPNAILTLSYLLCDIRHVHFVFHIIAMSVSVYSYHHRFVINNCLNLVQ